jgi:hypothetical protein
MKVDAKTVSRLLRALQSAYSVVTLAQMRGGSPCDFGAAFGRIISD